ncbi:MAG: TIGR02186 family protein [Pseudomonadota bacterium]|nr:TIGR02186 family protein [Pseudomonadota bacterium]
MTRRLAWLGFGLALVAFAPGARAVNLVSGLSQDQIEITSNYTGTDLVVFGAIESRAGESATSLRDVVVVVRGPDTEMKVRQKERVAGLWINRHEVTMKGMPGFYYLASSHPLAQIASPDVLARYQIGLSFLKASSYSAAGAKEDRIYTQAAVREETKAKLYAEAEDGVEFLSYSLFRVRVPVPAGVPRGQYTAEVYLFQDGHVVSAQSTPLFVDQTGLERRLYGFAHAWPWTYGITVVLLALLLGWISSLVFQRR